MRDWKESARMDCTLDHMENVPFGSIGGLNKRRTPRSPDYVPVGHKREYLTAYKEAAREMYGEKWRTVTFGWVPALTIPRASDA